MLVLEGLVDLHRTIQLQLFQHYWSNLNSILKSRAINLPTKFSIFQAMIFPVVIYGWKVWTIKKAEDRRIDAELDSVQSYSVEWTGLWWLSYLDLEVGWTASCWCKASPQCLLASQHLCALQDQNLGFCRCALCLRSSPSNQWACFLPCCCYSVSQSCLTFCNPKDCSKPGFTISQRLLRFMSIQLVMLSNQLILCRPFLFL